MASVFFRDRLGRWRRRATRARTLSLGKLRAATVHRNVVDQVVVDQGQQLAGRARLGKVDCVTCLGDLSIASALLFGLRALAATLVARSAIERPGPTETKELMIIQREGRDPPAGTVRKLLSCEVCRGATTRIRSDKGRRPKTLRDCLARRLGRDQSRAALTLSSDGIRGRPIACFGGNQ
jgi:hypothetical protein